MNRLLSIPALCVLLGYAALLAALHGATGRETATKRETPPANPYSVLASQVSGAHLLSVNEAQQVLTSLAREHMSSWRRYESSSHRLMSRASPSSIPAIPSISTSVAITPRATSDDDSFMLAAIAVTTSSQSRHIPCVIDRTTRRVRLFADNNWLTDEEWLKKAPRP